MNLIKVSIITSTYNAEDTIEDCIKSVLAQTYKNIEYIIIDGGSKDKTIAIVKSYADRFEGRLKWISEKDSGIYDAWNKGIRLSSGSWVSFLGGDDMLEDNAIKLYVDVINNKPGINFVSSKILFVKKDLRPLRIIGQPWSSRMKSINCVAHVGSMHAKSLFDAKGLYNSKYRISSDYDFFLRCLDIIKPEFIPVVTAKVREGGISGRQIFKVANETLEIKLKNKSRTVLICYLEYLETIVKYVVRVKVINKFFVMKDDAQVIHGVPIEKA